MIDLKNKKFGRLTALYPVRISQKRLKWHCICECGNECDVDGGNLRSGHTTSCGCYNKEQLRNKKLKDLTGQRFGKLVALEYFPPQKKDKIGRWKCQCDCGKTILVTQQALTQHGQQSCGCEKTPIGERNIAQVLEDNNIVYRQEQQFDDLVHKRKLRYDFAIFDKQDKIIRLIEFDGKQHSPGDAWYSDDIRLRDTMKNDYALKNHIPLVRIPYYMRDFITMGMLFGDKYLIKEKE